MSKNTSRLTPLSFDEATGRWKAKLGRKLTAGGKKDGHLFRFSPEQRESERRKQRIQELWDSLVAKTAAETYWSNESLAVAKAIADGEPQIVLKRRIIDHQDGKPVLESPDQYARYLHRMATTYPVISFVPEDADCYLNGKEQEEKGINTQIEKIKKGAAATHRLVAGSTILLDASDSTVGQALDAYEKHIRRTMLVLPDLEEGIDGKRLSDTAQSYTEDLDRIRTHNKHQLDWPLTKLTLQGCDAMIQVWRDRPPKKPRKKGDASPGQMSVKTCREHGKRLMAFFRWLSKSDDFDWTKPVDFDELKLHIKRTIREKAAQVGSLQVKPYMEEELRILNEYATPFERFLLLCGLNLGFKRMECATLRVGEIVLNQMHDHAKYIEFSFTDADSFVRRLRTKTEVYGEWILWPQTVEAMKWILARRKKQTHILKGDGKGRPIPCNTESLVLLNDNGHSFTKPTKSGNPNHQITNMWNRLLDRVEQDHKPFPRLPHEALRDTAANWIRHEFGGEIADIYLAHGSPLGTDSLIECYTNRPWGRVFEAIRWLAATKLAPMLKATPPNPFPEQRKLGGGGLTLKQKKLIRELSASGLNKTEVAKKVGCSTMSVYRHKSNDAHTATTDAADDGTPATT